MVDIVYKGADAVRKGFPAFMKEVAEKHQSKRICEVGGGANPLFSPDYIQSQGIDYTLLDISESELQKAAPEYKKIVADIASPDFDASAMKFDLVFSKMLAEHVKDGERFHKNIFEALAPSGIAVHLFPTLYTFPFVTNVLIPESFSTFLLNIFAPRDKYQYAKFPAYYSWCRGPTRRQIRRFTDLGYEVLEYQGLYGHSVYYKKIPIIRELHALKTNYLLKRPIPMLTSFACIILRKPPQ